MIIPCGILPSQTEAHNRLNLIVSFKSAQAEQSRLKQNIKNIFRSSYCLKTRLCSSLVNGDCTLYGNRILTQSEDCVHLIETSFANLTSEKIQLCMDLFCVKKVEQLL